MDTILALKNINKSFPGVQALDNVSLNVYPFRVMALLGENGAGKSTLVKIITGIYQRDAGSMILRGGECNFKSAKDSREAGIGIVHQELNLIPELTVSENIFLGREKSAAFARLDKKLMLVQTETILASMHFSVPAEEKIRNLSIAQQQMVEIAKCLSLDIDIIILDEPSDTLTEKETRNLFTVINNLKQQGKGVIYISHRLEEIFTISDDITVLRDGHFIAEMPTSNVNEQELIKLMVGRSLDEQIPYKRVPGGELVLTVKKLRGSYLDNINIELRAGEILGFAGLVGSGRTTLAKTIIGALQYSSGSIEIKGRTYDNRTVKAALKHGMTYLPEDRKAEGLVLQQSVQNNMSLSYICTHRGRLQLKKEEQEVQSYRERLRIRCTSIKQYIRDLSGGNQQKVSLARSLMLNPCLFILDEPTRGIDVGAKQEIYNFINELKQKGIAIMLISSEMPELLGLSDRIMVMHDGKIQGTLLRKDFDSRKIMSLALRQT